MSTAVGNESPAGEQAGAPRGAQPGEQSGAQPGEQSAAQSPASPGDPPARGRARAVVDLIVRAGGGEPRLVVDAGLYLAGCLAALSAFDSIYGGRLYVATGVVGLVAGMAAAIWARRAGMGPLTVLGVLVPVYVLLGGPLAVPETTIARVVPTVDTLRALATGLVTSWKGVLTTVPPVGTSGSLLVMLWFTALVTGGLGWLLAGRGKRSVTGLVGPTVIATVGILFGTIDPSVLALGGAAFGAVLLTWLVVRTRPSSPTVSPGPGADGEQIGAPARRYRRPLLAVALVVVSAVGGLLGYGYLPGALTQPRFILRDQAHPPFDPDRYPSPLASFRAYKVTPDDQPALAAPLLRVSGMPVGAPVQLATLDRYDGVVFGVSGGTGSPAASGYFQPVGTAVPPQGTGVPVDVKVQVLGTTMDGPWVPHVGETRSVTFLDEQDRAQALRDSYRYNRSTGDAVVTDLLAKGDSYELTGIWSAPPSRRSLTTASAGPPTLVPQVLAFPERVRQRAGELVGEAESPIARATALETALKRGGGYSDGLGVGAARYRSGHGSKRLNDFLVPDAQTVGNDEQYAATLALAARAQGFASRVVVGFLPKPGQRLDGVLRGRDVRAWVEVAFSTPQGVAWVPFDPTPTEPPNEQLQVPPPPRRPDPQPIPPPPPVRSANQVTAQNETQLEDTKKDRDAGRGLPTQLFVAIGVSAGIGALIGLPALFVTGLKARRTRRRRSGEGRERVLGGWDELSDRLADLGLQDARATRLQLAGRTGSPALAVLAPPANRAAGGPDPVDDDGADAYWASVDGAGRALLPSVTPMQHLRSVLSLASLRRPYRTTAGSRRRWPWRK